MRLNWDFFNLPLFGIYDVCTTALSSNSISLLQYTLDEVREWITKVLKFNHDPIFLSDRIGSEAENATSSRRKFFPKASLKPGPHQEDSVTWLRLDNYLPEWWWKFLSLLLLLPSWDWWILVATVNKYDVRNCGSEGWCWWVEEETRYLTVSVVYCTGIFPSVCHHQQPLNMIWPDGQTPRQDWPIISIFLGKRRFTVFFNRIAFFIQIGMQSMYSKSGRRLGNRRVKHK